MELKVVQPFRDLPTGELPPVGSVIVRDDARASQLIAAGVAVATQEPKPKARARKKTGE